MSTNNKPNVILPLVATLNERGTDGITNKNRDQHKINSMYEVAQNIQGESTVYLVNRPGATKIGTFAHADLNELIVSTQGDSSVGIAVDSSTLTVGTATAALGAAGYAAVYVDLTAVSNVQQGVVQVRNASDVQRVYFWNSSVAPAGLTLISDADFTGLTITGKMEHIDGWALIAAANRIYNSNLNSLSGWTAGQFVTKQIKQDIPYGLMKFGQQILYAGAETLEVFKNSGKESGSPLESVPSLAQDYGILKPTGTRALGDPDIGCVISHYSCELGKKMYFIGQRRKSIAITPLGSNASVFSYDGQTVEDIASPFISKILASNGANGIWSFAIGGESGIALMTSNATSSTCTWFVFFPRVKDWFEWTSTEFNPMNAGGFFSGAGSADYYYFAPNTENYFDDSATVTMTHTFKFPSNGNHYKTMHFFSVIADTPTGAGSLSIEFSTDDGTTWSAARTIDMLSAQKILTRCGIFRSLWVRLTWASNRQIRLEKVLARVE